MLLEKYTIHWIYKGKTTKISLEAQWQRKIWKNGCLAQETFSTNRVTLLGVAARVFLPLCTRLSWPVSNGCMNRHTPPVASIPDRCWEYWCTVVWIPVVGPVGPVTVRCLWSVWEVFVPLCLAFVQHGICNDCCWRKRKRRKKIINNWNKTNTCTQTSEWKCETNIHVLHAYTCGGVHMKVGKVVYYVRPSKVLVTTSY